MAQTLDSKSAAKAVDTPASTSSSARPRDLLEDSLNALESLIAWDAAYLFERLGEGLRLSKLAGDAAEALLGATINAAPDCGKSVPRVLAPADPLLEGLGLPEAKSTLLVPLHGPTTIQGLLVLQREEDRQWSTGVIELMDVFGRLLGAALECGEDSRRSSAERDRAEARTRMLESKANAARRVEAQTSSAMRFVTEHARRLATSQAPISIVGEAGSGLEVLARAIHSWNENATGSFVVFRCGVEVAQEHARKLFGEGDSPSCFALAEGGTLYLEDVERLRVDAQRQLTEFLGRDANVRVIAGSHAELSSLHEKLYFALAAFSLKIPPLRARREDVGRIASAYLAELSEEAGDGPWELAPRAIEWLERQEWPGNIRELINVLDRATILSDDPMLSFDTPPSTGVPPLQRGAQGISSLREVEKRHIDRVLRATNGQIYGPHGAAQLLEINPNTLRSRMKKLGLGGARSFRRGFGAEAATDEP